jgi:hypothetical protein
VRGRGERPAYRAKYFNCASDGCRGSGSVMLSVTCKVWWSGCKTTCSSCRMIWWANTRMGRSSPPRSDSPMDHRHLAMHWALSATFVAKAPHPSPLPLGEGESPQVSKKRFTISTGTGAVAETAFEVLPSMRRLKPVRPRDPRMMTSHCCSVAVARIVVVTSPCANLAS